MLGSPVRANDHGAVAGSGALQTGPIWALLLFQNVAGVLWPALGDFGCRPSNTHAIISMFYESTRGPFMLVAAGGQKAALFSLSPCNLWFSIDNYF